MPVTIDKRAILHKWLVTDTVRIAIKTNTNDLNTAVTKFIFCRRVSFQIQRQITFQELLRPAYKYKTKLIANG